MARALLSVKDFTGSSNPYINLFVSALPDSVEPVPMSWRRALLGRYQVFHVHWPEYLFRADGRVRQFVKALLAAAFLMRLSLLRIPVVTTMHNLHAHESGSRVEQGLVRWLDRLTVVRIYLNESPENNLQRGIVVLHARYPRSTLRQHPTESLDRPTILFFGQLRPYKGLEELVKAFRGTEMNAKLVIAGAAAVRSYAEDVEQLVGRSDDIDLAIRHLDDEELAERISDADLIVLPYKYLYNSGAAIMALGSGKGIVVPRSGSTTALAEEVGPGWVHLFDAPLQPSDLIEALNTSRNAGPGGSPDLSRREPTDVGVLHGAIYDALIAQRRLPRVKQRAAVLAALRRDRRFQDHSGLNR